MGLYEDSKDYSQILQDVHDRMILKMKTQTLKKNAQELQTILQEIKLVADHFNPKNNSPVSNELLEQYQDLVKQAFEMQKGYHQNSFTFHTLFHRAYSPKSVLKSGADDIFEEDLAAILAAGEFLGGNETIQLNSFLTGGQSSSTRAVSKYNPLTTMIDGKNVTDLLKELAEKESKRVSTQVREATGKIDVNGQAVTLNYTKSLPIKVERLMQLMKDATFSAKNYTSHAWDINNTKDWTEIGLDLGNTNLYKAVTGALSELQIGYKQQTKFFFRGMQTILNNSHSYGDLTAQHFTHLRFIYELRGSGLLNDQGLVTPVKYLIYNDPSSNAIFVKDTASIILEALNSATRTNNLLGSITLSASKVKN